MNRPLIEVQGLRKVFDDPSGGLVIAVDELSFQVQAGEIYGLLGPNGAGKTTTLRCLASLTRPTLGDLRIGGRDPSKEPLEVKARIGFLAAGAGLPPRHKGSEVLRFFATLYGLDEKATEEAIERATEFFDLAEILEKPTDALSTGQKQRLNLARATLHSPPVLLLDEATSGLDPLVARRVRLGVRRLADEGKGIVFSTHIMSEAEAVCDRVGIVHEGKLVAEGSPHELRQSTDSPDLESAFVSLVDA
jgi:sodium transport system ATP-binding protein